MHELGNNEYMHVFDRYIHVLDEYI